MSIVLYTLGFACLVTFVASVSLVGILTGVALLCIFWYSEMVFKFQLSNLLIQCEKYFEKKKMVCDWTKTCLVKAAVEEKATDCKRTECEQRVEYQNLANQLVQSLRDGDNEGKTIDITITNVSRSVPHSDLICLGGAGYVLVAVCVFHGDAFFTITTALWYTCFIAFYVCVTRTSLFHLEFRYLNKSDEKLWPFRVGYSNKEGFIWDRNPTSLRTDTEEKEEDKKCLKDENEKAGKGLQDIKEAQDECVNDTNDIRLNVKKVHEEEDDDDDDDAAMYKDLFTTISPQNRKEIIKIIKEYRREARLY